MARVVETEQVKRKKRKKNILKVVLFVIILFIVILLSYKFIFSKWGSSTKNVPKILDTVENYDYVLSDKDTKLYKQEYDKLKEILKKKDIDEKEYATQVAKMFVIDLYSLNSKMNKYDVGGTEFYYRDKRTMYETKVMDTLYNTLQDDTYGDRKQDLPEVSSIEEVSVEEVLYSMSGKEVSAYLIKLKWSYVKNMQYDDEGSVVVTKDDFRMSVVDFQPTLNPNYNKKNK